MTEIVKYPNELLSTPTIDFNFINPQIDPYELVQEMLKTMNESKGIGLSANQIGHRLKVFVMRGADQNYACFNPKIVHLSDDHNTLEEGCLSFPGINVKIKRANTVRLRFSTASGGIDTKTFAGLTARVVQHEMDHLDGVLFFNRANRYHREKAMKGYYNGKLRINA
ncbi:Def N-formylmethionyl-tRNA deformylase [uncultured Caudovirales phage]|uniref:Def N-formylmethionyl-tRNA deformylase n=1 Tax=uncultured Caudovirales phage TaxID=2100421 RepID=A0A6J7WZD1_9CAUD|nr:Def N-formylmethionyl-tRNA deformylase [uncultured Caudovirales phage]